jgi:23S rRNA pseudouridine1911/1915/1917 synthase
VKQQLYTVLPEQAGQTVTALLRQWLPGQSWSQIKQLIAGRRVKVNGELWLDAARRLKPGDTVETLSRPAP